MFTQKDVDYITESELKVKLCELKDKNFSLDVLVDKIDYFAVELYEKVSKILRLEFEKLVYLEKENDNLGKEVIELNEISKAIHSPWLSANLVLRGIKIPFEIYYIKENKELVVFLAYNLFQPEVYVLDESGKNLIKVKNPVYKEYKEKFAKLKEIFVKNLGNFEILEDTLGMFKPENQSISEYHRELKERVKKEIANESRNAVEKIK